MTNYTGETRDYLKKLITLMGGEFTPSLSTKNTILVAAQYVLSLRLTKLQTHNVRQYGRLEDRKGS